MGQSRPVQVIHLLTEGSIEERVWQTVRLTEPRREALPSTGRTTSALQIRPTSTLDHPAPMHTWRRFARSP